MIEKLLKKTKPVFSRGEVVFIDTAGRKARVRMQSGLSVLLSYPEGENIQVGDSVIVADGGVKFIVQSQEKTIPSQGSLLLV